MGILLSKFKRKKQSKEMLEELERRIEEINGHNDNVERNLRRLQRGLTIFALFSCIGGLFYLYFVRPKTMTEKFYATLAVLLFVVLMLCLHKGMKWFFRRTMTSNKKALSDTLEKKKQVLKEVMETETYNVALELLRKYSPETRFENPQRSTTMPISIPSSTRVRRRGILGTPRNTAPFYSGRSSTVPMAASQMRSFRPDHPRFTAQKPVPPVPSYIERVAGFLVGENLSSRYALICQFCSAHNGLAAPEEFHFIGFTCFNCTIFNPAKQQRPAAPRLPRSSSSNSDLVGTVPSFRLNDRPFRRESSSVEADDGLLSSENTDDFNGISLENSDDEEKQDDGVRSVDEVPELEKDDYVEKVSAIDKNED